VKSSLFAETIHISGNRINKVLVQD